MRYKVPFVRQDDYISLYNQTTDSEKVLYDMINDNGAIWVRHLSYHFRFIRMSHPC